MFDEFLRKADELRRADEPFAIALVVRSTPPISGKAGDKAIVRQDGSVWGWIGGGCAQPAVIKESLKAIEDGKPKLVRISPDGDPRSLEEEGPGVREYRMTCHSGGALDIYIEPVLPKPHIVIFGRSLVAQTLARLATDIHYSVTIISPDATAEAFPTADSISQELDLTGTGIGRNTFIVVSTQGEYDEDALRLATESEAAYIGFVASRAKAQKIFEYLESGGASRDRLAQVKVPAGININATVPEEIAVSILAEIVETRTTKATLAAEPRRTRAGESERTIPNLMPEAARDPVCGMTVDPRSARDRSEYGSRTILFCCERCKHEFDKDPERYVGPAVQNI
ncbi:MAG TPA: XdhC family protein [Blastocatellia bacterium]|nr:XdhC family protein [Blastocatellia bacterium]